MQAKALAWLERLGPRACFAFLPIIMTRWPPSQGGLLPFWPCFLWAAHKFLRYVVMTAGARCGFGWVSFTFP